MAANIYISYRRDDTRWSAQRLFEGLARRFGRRAIFMDIDAIAPGVDFAHFIERKLSEASAVLVLIGPRWLQSTDVEGLRRLDDPTDFIRREIASALARDIPVIPVLVDGAFMPRMTDLP